MSRSHTKLPWATHDGGHIQNEDGDVVVWGSGLAAKNRLHNTRFIVKAGNNFDPLMNALQKARQALECGSFNAHGKAQRMYSDALREVEQAIKDAS